jgi:PII-like signaling protein
MKTAGQAHLLRIFVNESDRWEGRALYETIVRLAREQGLAGATAFRAIEGFGAAGRVHSVKVLHLSEDVPIIVEIIDSPERIAAFLPTLDRIIAEGAVTIETIHLVTYRRDSTQSTAPQTDDEIPLDTSESTPAVESRPIFSELTDTASQIIDAAKASAASSRRVYIDSVDVLLVILRDPDGIARSALTNLGLDCRVVVRSLRDVVNRDETSDAFQTDLETKSLAAAKWLGHNYVSTEHLLLALCEIRPSAATDILMRLGVLPRDVCKEVLTILNHKDDWQAWLADHPDM